MSQIIEGIELLAQTEKAWEFKNPRTSERVEITKTGKEIIVERHTKMWTEYVTMLGGAIDIQKDALFGYRALTPNNEVIEVGFIAGNFNSGDLTQSAADAARNYFNSLAA